MSCSAREGLNKKCFVLIDHILSETVCLFCSLFVLCFKITAVKLILWPKMGLTYAISIVNLIFGFFLLENNFCFSSQILNYSYSMTIL